MSLVTRGMGGDKVFASFGLGTENEVISGGGSGGSGAGNRVARGASSRSKSGDSRTKPSGGNRTVTAADRK